MLKKRKKHKDIAEALHWTFPNMLLTVFQFSIKVRELSILMKKHVVVSWEKRQLSPEQQKEIQCILIDKYPNQLKLNFMLWTRAAVYELIYDKYGITITLRNISEYLKRLGMTCQRPTRKAYFQDNVKLNTFMNETYMR